MDKVARNYSIDILRIISMVGVVVLHTLGHGGILSSSVTPTNFTMAWFLEILAYPSVNCFVLISGYVGYKSERVFPRIKNILSLWLTVAFYSIVIYFLFVLLGPTPFGVKNLIKSLLPTLTSKYWFFSAYVGLFLLMPLLNRFVQNSTLRDVLYFGAVLFTYSVVSIISDTFTMLSGYSVIWFAFMYLAGAIIKKYGITQIFSKKTWVILVSLAFAVTFLSKVILHFANIPFFQPYSEKLVNYLSPTIVLMAIGLLAIFVNTKSSSCCSTIIPFFSSSAFSVYLIHDNPYVRQYVISNIHTLVENRTVIPFLLIIICCVITIFMSCILIDKVKLWLFRIVKTELFLERTEKIFNTLLISIYNTAISWLQRTTAE